MKWFGRKEGGSGNSFDYILYTDCSDGVAEFRSSNLSLSCYQLIKNFNPRGDVVGAVGCKPATRFRVPTIVVRLTSDIDLVAGGARAEDRKPQDTFDDFKG